MEVRKPLLSGFFNVASDKLDNRDYRHGFAPYAVEVGRVSSRLTEPSLDGVVAALADVREAQSFFFIKPGVDLQLDGQVVGFDRCPIQRGPSIGFRGHLDKHAREFTANPISICSATGAQSPHDNQTENNQCLQK